MVLLNVVVEDASHQPAQVSDALLWREQFDLLWPVLADTEEAWVNAWGNANGGTFIQHSYTVLDGDGVVRWRSDGYTAATEVDIIEAVEAIAP